VRLVGVVPGWMTSREVYAWGVTNGIRINTKYHMKLSGSLNKVLCNTVIRATFCGTYL